MRQDTKAAERPTRPQPLYNMHNETVNNRRLYMHIVQIFTDTPIFRKVNPRIALFFHQQKIDLPQQNFDLHKKNTSSPTTVFFPRKQIILKKNLSFPRFWQTNIGFHSFLNEEMIKLMILVFVSYSIAILLLTKYVDYRKMRTTF